MYASRHGSGEKSLWVLEGRGHEEGRQEETESRAHWLWKQSQNRVGKEKITCQRLRTFNGRKQEDAPFTSDGIYPLWAGNVKGFSKDEQPRLLGKQGRSEGEGCCLKRKWN